MIQTQYLDKSVEQLFLAKKSSHIGQRLRDLGPDRAMGGSVGQ